MSKKSKSVDADAYLSWVEVDLSAIRDNYRLVRNHLPTSVELYPVVKADAYGHGAVKVVRLLQDEGVNRVCVARVEEAVELRGSGINISILVFTPPLSPQAMIAAENSLEIVVCDPAHVNAVAEAQKITGKPIPVHIKTDIGMGRLGVRPDDVSALYAQCRSLNVIVRGIMSHFPCADSCDPAATLAMTETFRAMKDQISSQFPDQELMFHVSNTAATLRFPQAWFNAVRSGISLYGQYPSVDMEKTLPLRPAMNLKTRIIFLKDVPAGTAVSYCHTYHTPQDARLATLALGYADGYPRHASNHTEFLLHGKRAPQVGRVCMDQLLIDVTDIPEASIGDEVLAFGRSDDGTLPAEEVAERFNSLGYELTSRIGKRLPRFFVENDSPNSLSNPQPD